MGSAAAAPSWQSPVPYLFCGLAAMLGLIGFSLLLLGCSYWKLYVSSRDGAGDEITDGGEKAVVEEKYLVIMAGQERPTFLAKPSSFGIKSSESSQIEMGIHEST